MVNPVVSLTSVPRLPQWRFWVPLLLQVLLIISIPASVVHTYLTGKTVVLQTAPIDPYSPILGYSQTLSYDISLMDNLRELPGWKTLPKDSYRDNYKLDYLVTNSTFYLVLEAPSNNQVNNQTRQPWRPVAISAKPPINLPANQIFLKGKAKLNQAEYGLETYYMPEDRIREINQEFTDVQRTSRSQNKLPPIVMEVKIDNEGAGVPVSLWVRDRQYTF
jgi:uncharacterized membrane-anchored protein